MRLTPNTLYCGGAEKKGALKWFAHHKYEVFRWEHILKINHIYKILLHQ